MAEEGNAEKDYEASRMGRHGIIRWAHWLFASKTYMTPLVAFQPIVIALKGWSRDSTNFEPHCLPAWQELAGMRSSASDTLIAELADAVERVPTRFVARLPFFLKRIGTMNIVAAEVTRRKLSAPQNPPRYLGGYDQVHGENWRVQFENAPPNNPSLFLKQR